MNRQPEAAEFRIGVISDTHGLLRPQAVDRLRGVHHIIHAGDIGNLTILEALQALAPTTAVRGNVDTGAWAEDCPDTATVTLAGFTLHVVHRIADLSPAISSRSTDVVIVGHSHRASLTARDGLLVLNPGSAGPRRFGLPVTLATLSVVGGRATPEVHQLLP